MQLSLRESPNSRHGFLRRKFQLLLPASILLLVAACGGGGGGGDPPSAPANPPPPPPPPPTNAAPTAQAGADQSIDLPRPVSLQGSATDDGPAASLTYAWSGPSGVTFASPTAAATAATFASEGSYTLTLTANDGTTSGTDTVVVTVTAPIFPAADPSGNPDPNHGWQKVTAASEVGMEQAPLDAAATYAQTYENSVDADRGAGMIVRYGRIVHSWGNTERRYDLKSTTKSMGGIALGLAIDDGKLALADSAKTHLLNIGLPPPENATLGADQITVLQLATHTAGFPKLGGYLKLESTPGTTFFYSDGGLNWLADLLTVTFQQDLSTLLATRVWSKLGVGTTDIQWRENALRPAATRPAEFPANLVYRELASGIIANVNSMARVGLLFLRHGVWNGERIVGDDSFVEIVQTPRAENATLANPQATDFPGATADYGVLWWTNASGQMANVPRDTYWAWGLGESLIVVIPSLDLVIARAGPQSTAITAARTWNDLDHWNGDYAVLKPFLDPIVDAATP